MHPDRHFMSLIADHDRAVREFVDRARAVHAARWLTPRAEGKWSPAQEVRHVTLTYAEFVRQLQGQSPIRLRGGLYTRIMSRAIGLTSILWLKKIPVAVRAPREVRPDSETRTADELLPELEARTAAFSRVFADAWNAKPRPRIQHPLFGRVSLATGIRFLAVHTRHHAAFLPPPGRS